ncbi:MAG: AMP-binding protein [Hyphomicrobiales bacterium]|nr:AMP-binding protein [Hyphomicrobiales bacterium]
MDALQNNPPVNMPPLAERNVSSVMRRALAEHPDKMAVRDEERALTYRGLVDAALVMAGGFGKLGVGRQQSVLLMLDNHLDFVVAWIALSLSARVEVPVNTAYRAAILAHVVNNCGAEVMVIEDVYCARLAEIAGQLANLKKVVVRGDATALKMPDHIEVLSFSALEGVREEIAHVDPWDLVGIMYTSGTTGLSKGVRVTHAHAYGYCSPAVYTVATEDDVNLVLLPLFHVGGQWAGVYNALIAGGSAVVLPRFSATQFWDQARAYGCTNTLLLGAMASFLYRQPRLPNDAEQPLKCILMVPVMPELEDFKARFGVERVGTGFGSTEASTILRAPPGAAIPDQAGWLREDVQIRVVDANDMDVAPGSTGEMLVRSTEPWTIMDGYHAMPDATVAAWRNLWFHTGDVVRQDLTTGQYVFVDRSKDALRRRGENVSSFEVEREILEHPDVLECAIVAVPSDASEDDIKACVVLKEGATLEGAALLDFLLPRLPDFMVPRYVEFLAQLPKTPTEKIRKAELRAAGVTAATWDREDVGYRVRR